MLGITIIIGLLILIASNLTAMLIAVAGLGLITGWQLYVFNQIREQNYNLQQQINEKTRQIQAQDADHRQFSQKTDKAIKQTNESLQRTNESLQRTNESLQQTNTSLRQANDSLRATVAQIDQKYQKKVTDLQASLVGRFETERSRRIAEFARREGGEEIPARIVIMLTVHRCGSTWLFDMLRVHPALIFLPSAIIYTALSLNGGRYPVGLSDGLDATMDLENQPGRGRKIPRFKLIDKTTVDVPDYHIEKIHPLFFENDVDALLTQVEALRDRGHEIKFIYQVRDPSATISSFRKYQQRDPNWYSDIHEDALPEFMLGAYKTIAEFASQEEGLIVDYAELKADPLALLMRIYQYIWPDVGEDQIDIFKHIAETALNATTREKRIAKAQTAFLGQKEGPVQGSEAGELKADGTHDQLYQAYQELLALQS